MHLRALPSLVRAALALLLPVALAASCGGKVLVEDPPSAECGAGLTLCQGACVDLKSDFSHCGGCDSPCYEGTCSDGVCVWGPTPTCPPNLSDCFGDCVDPSSDPYNCGGCGLYCDSGICDLGNCVTGECYCGGLCEVIFLSSDVPQSAWAPAYSDQWVPACVSGSGPDVVFAFTAPYDGVYYFDTYGTPVSAVLEVLDPACYSYDCASAGGTGGATVTPKLGAGQLVLVVVDTQGPQTDVQLNISYDGDGGGCATCADVIQTGDPGNGFCPGSDVLYDKLVNCICVEQCGMACSDVCSGQPMTPECENCIYDQSFGCGMAFDACLNDV